MRTNDEVGTDFRFNLKALEVATSLIFGISPGNDAPGGVFFRSIHGVCGGLLDCNAKFYYSSFML